jgi:CHAT domain-containing protein
MPEFFKSINIIRIVCLLFIIEAVYLFPVPVKIYSQSMEENEAAALDYFGKGKYDKSLYYIEKFLESIQDNRENDSVYIQALIIKAQAMEFIKGTKECEELLYGILKNIEKSRLNNTITHGLALHELARYKYNHESIPLLQKALGIILERKGKDNFEYSESQLLLADILKNNGKTREADSILIKAVDMRKMLFGERHINYLIPLLKSTYVCFINNKFDDYKNNLKKATLKRRRIFFNNEKQEVEYLRLLGSLNRYSDSSLAEFYLKESLTLAISRFGNEHILTARCYHTLADFYLDKENYFEAEKYLNAACNILIHYPEISSCRYGGYFSCLNLLLRTQITLNRQDEVLNILEEIQKKSEMYPDIKISLIVQNLFPEDEAVKQFQSILENAYADNEKHKSDAMPPLRKLSLLYSLSDLYIYKEDIPHAHIIQDSLYEIRKRQYEAGEIDGKLFIEDILRGSLVYNAAGEFMKSEMILKEGIKILDSYSNPDPYQFIHLHDRLAVCLCYMGLFNEAENTFMESLKFQNSSSISDSFLYPNTLKQLGDLYYTMGRNTEAENTFKEAIKLYSQIRNFDKKPLAMCKRSLASVYSVTNRNTEAIELILESSEILNKGFGRISYYNLNTFIDLGFNYMNLDSLLKAEEYFTEALEIFNDLTKTNHAFHPSLYSGLAKLYDLSGRYEKSEFYWNKIIDAYINRIQDFFLTKSEHEKNVFIAMISEIFERFNNFAIKRSIDNPGISGLMYDVSLFTKALILNSSGKMKKSILESGDSLLIGKYNSWQDLRKNIAKYYFIENLPGKTGYNSDSMQSVADEKEKEINILLNSKYNGSNLKKENDRINWKSVQESLQPGEAAIEVIKIRDYKKSFNDSIKYAFLILTKETINRPELVILDNGNNPDSNYYRIYKKEISLPEFGSSSYNNYWEKIDKKLDSLSKEKITRIYFSPDGIYHNINIETLKAPDGKYLIDKYDIILTGNTKSILNRRTKNTQNLTYSGNKKAYLFGNPNYALECQKLNESYDQKQTPSNNKYRNVSSFSNLENINLTSLPQTRKEISIIAGILKKNGYDTKLFTWNDAREDTIKSLCNPAILHIATHGFYLDPEKSPGNDSLDMIQKIFDSNPLFRSMLFFAGSKKFLSLYQSGNFKNMNNFLSGDDGILTAEEVRNLTLDSTELVVLSACESGKGKVQAGEGMYGMQRSLTYAGAKSVIMSLWMVDDDISRKLMTLFYYNWMKTGDKVQAFRNAKLKIKKFVKIPYDWGSFVMVGE